VPVAELLLTKLQIVGLNERDERDIYTLGTTTSSPAIPARA
jgi:hypothetical protein